MENVLAPWKIGESEGAVQLANQMTERPSLPCAATPLFPSR